MDYGRLETTKPSPRTGSARSRLVNYRYPTEWWMLVITVLIIGVALFLAQALSIVAVAIFFIFGTAINYLFIRSYIESFKRQAVEISDTQFPEIQALIDECRQHVEIPPDTRFFVSYSPYMNAFAVGLGRPYSIILFSALIDQMDTDELKYVISHEMGHIKFGHTILLTLIGQLGVMTYGLPLLGPLYRFFFLGWSRTAELSADRAGLVGCGHLDKAISAQVKFGAGPWLADRVNIRALAQQAQEARGNFFAAFVETLGTHPLMTSRIQRLVKFAASEAFRILRPDGRQASTAEATPEQAGDAETKRQRIRRLAPTREASPALSAADGSVASPSETGTQPPPPNPVTEDSSSTTQADWAQEISFQRLNAAALRANTEQAEMWLRLGEMLEVDGQSEQATICLQHAKTLITSPASAAPLLGQFPFQSGGPAQTIKSPQSGSLKTSTSPACPTCGAANPTGAHYCYQCQTQLQKPCLQCEAWLPARFPNCPQCGQNQTKLISTLKSEANRVRKIAERPLPPRRLTRWELTYGSIFLIDVILVLSTLAWRISDADLAQAAPYFAGAFLVPVVGIVIGIIWAKRRARRYWLTFDEADVAIRRYNDVADTLAKHNIVLDPPRLELNDPWR